MGVKQRGLEAQPHRLAPSLQGDYDLECWSFLERLGSHKACLLKSQTKHLPSGA